MALQIDDGHEEQGEKNSKDMPGDGVPGEAQNDLNNVKLESEPEVKQMENLDKEMSSLNINEKPRFVARLRGLPWSAREKEIKEFFKDEKIVEIQVVFSPDGKASGVCVLFHVFVSACLFFKGPSAYSKNKQNLGHRYIEIFKATGNDIDVASGRTSRASCVSPKTQYIVRMRGLPYEATENDVNKFFSDLNIGTTSRSCFEIVLWTHTVAVHLIKDDLGRPSGEGFVEFASEDDVNSAMTKHRHNIGRRYIELFRSGRDDLTKMLGLSQRGHVFGRKHFPPQKYNYRKNHQQRSDINSSCLLMRGLPYSCSETDITKFFQEIDVTPVRIHRKADGAEAYVEFCSNTDCTKAMTRHKVEEKKQTI
ncbi:hypothetical protein RFI_01230 [Reticulomyxa filosa]|uniref:RRM domain-containing protein n=1 Tax=Reticulomyxa filosa TaxID=46433 RepID=X6PBA4_RETFI|nr:hypothetical protein RFI_01230 [Reticulomyxa filosa]|eukprot:ETO35830.1 hypothetical protein RFI_01230 [Reticulomyxa filosa]